jgi:hypothetical protein
LKTHFCIEELSPQKSEGEGSRNINAITKIIVLKYEAMSRDRNHGIWLFGVGLFLNCVL